MASQVTTAVVTAIAAAPTAPGSQLVTFTTASPLVVVAAITSTAWVLGQTTTITINPI